MHKCYQSIWFQGAFLDQHQIWEIGSSHILTEQHVCTSLAPKHPVGAGGGGWVRDRSLYVGIFSSNRSRPSENRISNKMAFCATEQANNVQRPMFSDVGCRYRSSCAWVREPGESSTPWEEKKSIVLHVHG